MTCAKKIVRCTIITREGTPFVGENICGAPQKECPRLPGDGYEKCKTICEQACHAEINAMINALADGKDLKDATAVVTGIDHVCKECSRALSEAGVSQVIIRNHKIERKVCNTRPKKSLILFVGKRE